MTVMPFVNLPQPKAGRQLSQSTIIKIRLWKSRLAVQLDLTTRFITAADVMLKLVTVALLDRLRHHSHIMLSSGVSYLHRGKKVAEAIPTELATLTDGKNNYVGGSILNWR